MAWPVIAHIESVRGANGGGFLPAENRKGPPASPLGALASISDRGGYLLGRIKLVHDVERLSRVAHHLPAMVAG